MATRLYLGRNTPTYIPTTYRGTWNGTFTISTRSVTLNPDKASNEGSTLASGSASASVTPWKQAHTVGVSPRLLPQTISGNLDICIGVDQNGLNDMEYWKLHIYVVNETTNTVHGTLLNNYEESLAGGATEFAFSTNTGKPLKAPTALTSVTIPADSNHYRIIAEIGYVFNQIVPNTAAARIRRGTNNSSDFTPFPDLAVGSTTTQDEAGFIEFPGSLTFDVTIPPNQTYTTAIDITSLPFNLTFDPTAAYPLLLWYKYTPTTDTVLSILGCNIYESASVTVYQGTSSVPPFSYKTSMYGGQPQIWPVKAGAGPLFFEVYSDDYTTGDTIVFSVIEGPTNPIQKGDIIISEDYGHGGQNIYDPSFRGLYPYIWYGEDGTLRYVTAKLPATEVGCCLTNGKWGIVDFDNNQVFIYNMAPGLTEVGRFPLPPGPANDIDSMATDFNYFYVITSDGTNHNTVYKVTDTGTITGPIATLAIHTSMGAAGSGGNAVAGVSRDGSILYYNNYIMGGQVCRHNLLTNTALAPFTTPDVNTVPGDVIVLSDGTIAAIFYAGLINKVAHYAVDGTLLHYWDFGTYPWEIHHIVHEGNDHPNKIWVWIQDENSSYPSEVGLSKFQLLELSTGTILKNIIKDSFDGGVGPFDPSNGCVPAARFGAPNSCPLMVVMRTDDTVIIPPVDIGGIYFINKVKTTKHDSYYNDVEKKIPDPMVKLSLVGE